MKIPRQAIAVCLGDVSLSDLAEQRIGSMDQYELRELVWALLPLIKEEPLPGERPTELSADQIVAGINAAKPMVADGRTIQAIKAFRDVTNAGLRDSKVIIDAVRDVVAYSKLPF